MGHLLSLGGSLLKFVAAKEQPQLRIHGGGGDCSGRGHPVQQAQALDSEHTGKTVDRSEKATVLLYFNEMKKKNRHKIQTLAASSSDPCGSNKLLNWAAKTFWYQMTMYSSLVFIIFYFCVSYKTEL